MTFDAAVGEGPIITKQEHQCRTTRHSQKGKNQKPPGAPPQKTTAPPPRNGRKKKGGPGGFRGPGTPPATHYDEWPSTAFPDAHCCLNAHASYRSQRRRNFILPSTNYRVICDRLGDAVALRKNKIHVDVQHWVAVGSKFNLDSGDDGALLSKRNWPACQIHARSAIWKFGYRGNASLSQAKSRKERWNLDCIDVELVHGGTCRLRSASGSVRFTKIRTRTSSAKIGQIGRHARWRGPNHPQVLLTDVAMKTRQRPMDAEFFLRTLR